MQQSQLSLNTQDGQRIAKRLYNHWQHKFAVSHDTQSNKHIFGIHFTDDDTVTLTSDDKTLVVILTTKQPDNHNKLQHVVLDHINRMANSNFDDTWVNL